MTSFPVDIVNRKLHIKSGILVDVHESVRVTTHTRSSNDGVGGYSQHSSTSTRSTLRLALKTFDGEEIHYSIREEIGLSAIKGNVLTIFSFFQKDGEADAVAAVYNHSTKRLFDGTKSLSPASVNHGMRPLGCLAMAAICVAMLYVSWELAVACAVIIAVVIVLYDWSSYRRRRQAVREVVERELPAVKSAVAAMQLDQPD